MVRYYNSYSWWKNVCIWTFGKKEKASQADGERRAWNFGHETTQFAILGVLDKVQGFGVTNEDGNPGCDVALKDESLKLFKKVIKDNYFKPHKPSKN